MAVRRRPALEWAQPTPVLFWASQLRKISSGQIAFLAPVMKSYLDSFGLNWISWISWAHLSFGLIWTHLDISVPRSHARAGEQGHKGSLLFSGGGLVILSRASRAGRCQSRAPTHLLHLYMAPSGVRPRPAPLYRGPVAASSARSCAAAP